MIDIVFALTDSTNPRDYWYKMKIRVAEEDGFEPSTIYRQFKMKASDGKKYATDCVNTEGIFRIIQSIPSPKAEPLKGGLPRSVTNESRKKKPPKSYPPIIMSLNELKA